MNPAHVVFSQYAHAEAVQGTQTTLGAVVSAIRVGTWGARVAEIRQAYQGAGGGEAGKTAAAPLKKTLPGVTFSGRFNGRRKAANLAAPSGLICADLDLLGADLAHVRAALTGDARTLALFLSPSGDGLKAVFRCDPARPHREAFHAARAHVLQLVGREIDPACKDVSRLCFVSHDPEAYLAPDPEAVPLFDYPEPEPEPVNEAEHIPGDFSKEDVAELLRCVPPRPDYDQWLRIASAVWSVLSEEDGYAVLSAWSPEENPGEYAEKYPDRLSAIGIGTLIRAAKANGWKPSLAFKVTLPDVLPGVSTSPICFDGQSYWRMERDGRYGKLGREDVKLELKARGLSARVAKGATCEVSQVDAALLDIQRNNRVTYAAPFCGRPAGLYQENGEAVLATDSPSLIAAGDGDCTPLEIFFRNLLGAGVDPHAEEQFCVFVAWLKRWRQALANPGEHLPGQALFLVGPKACGKSLSQTLLTRLCGGREADPSAWLSGRSEFNGSLWGAEHLAMSDANVEDSYAARRALRDAVKRIVANPTQPCHRKHRNEINLRPVWRLTVSANPDADSATILPPLDESTADKVIYLKCYPPPSPFPTADGGAAFLASLRAAMPAFLSAVESVDVPAALRGERFGLREWQHPEIKAMLENVHPDADAAGMIDDWLHSCLETEMTGTASNVYQWIERAHPGSVAWVRACRSPVAFGQLLARLAKVPAWNGRITSKPGHGGVLQWTIKKAA